MNVEYFVVGAAVCVAVYQIVKWVIAAALAPASYGSSFAFAALAP